MRWALLLLFACLPLQWIVVSMPGRGATPVHLLGVVAFLVVAFLRYRLPAFRPVASVTAAFLVANAVLIAAWLATALYHGTGVRGPVLHAVQAAAFLAVAVVIYQGARARTPTFLRYARWTALACSGSLLAGLAVSAGMADLDVVSIGSRSLTQGDAGVVPREFFAPAFQTFGLDPEDAGSQLRHEIFGALLTAIFISLAAARLQPFRSPAATMLFRMSIAVSALLIVTSESRAVLIAAVAWPALAIWRLLRSGRLTGGQLALTGVAAAGGVALAAAGVVSVIWARFTEDTRSYEARDAFLELTLDELGERWITGGFNTVGSSSHNLVLDNWLRAGIFGGAAALVIVVLLIGLFLSLAARIHLEPDWVLPVTCALALPIVRAFTAGGGSLGSPVQWVVLGVVAGFLTLRAGDRFRGEPPAAGRDRDRAPVLTPTR